MKTVIFEEKHGINNIIETHKEVLWTIAITIIPFVMFFVLFYLYFNLMPTALVPVSIFDDINIINSMESTFLSFFVVIGIPFLYFLIVVFFKERSTQKGGEKNGI